MAYPDIDESTSLLGEALEKLMATEDEQPEESVQVGHAMEFHRYLDLPDDVQKMIIEEAINQEDWIARWASVSKEWQEEVEKVTFYDIRIDPSVEEDVLMFKQMFKNERRSYLETLEIILDDRPTGPWHTANGIVQISQVMEKVGIFFHYLNSWNPDQITADLEIRFVSVDSGFEGSDDSSIWLGPPGLEPSIQTTSLWTKHQLDLLGNSNSASDKPLWAAWSEYPESFDWVGWLTFPLDCVPLPATIAIIGKMPNLVSCDFELAFGRIDLQSAENEGIARLTEFIEQLPTLAPSLRDLSIRNTGEDVLSFGVDNGDMLSAALRDSSQGLRSLKVEGIHLRENFFDSFGEEESIIQANLKWKWPNLEELKLSIMTFGPEDQLRQTSTQLFIAAGRANVAMPLLRNFEVEVWDDEDVTMASFTTTAPPQNLPRSGECTVKLEMLTTAQEQRILCAWTAFLGAAEPRLVTDSTELPVITTYKTIPQDCSLSTSFGGGALVHRSKLLEAQRIARANSGVQSVPEV